MALFFWRLFSQILEFIFHNTFWRLRRHTSIFFGACDAVPAFFFPASGACDATIYPTAALERPHFPRDPLPKGDNL